MASGVVALEYRIDGGPLIRIEAGEGETLSIPIPPTYNGYAVVEIWVYDIAENIYHDTFWYWLEGGVVKSVQPVKDGKYRVIWDYHGTSVEPKPIYYNIWEENILSVEVTPMIYRVVKLKDQVNC